MCPIVVSTVANDFLTIGKLLLILRKFVKIVLLYTNYANGF